MLDNSFLLRVARTRGALGLSSKNAPGRIARIVTRQRVGSKNSPPTAVGETAGLSDGAAP